MRKFDIQKPDESLRETIAQKIDNLNKPKGSLGRLESLAMQMAMIQQTLSPTLRHPCHLLLGGDHGIEREGVSLSPRDVTWQQMINFTRGGGGVNMFCRQHGFDLKIVDMGVDYDLSAYPTIIDRKIARGTDNFLYRPAMNESQFHQAIDTGAELVDECRRVGADIICIGEMGIANTSPSSIWMSLWGNIPLQECIGAGSGLNDEGIARKCAILQRAVDNFLAAGNDPDNPETVIRYFAGYEMAGAIGAMLRAAELKMAVMVDGFIMSACMLAASRLYPDVLRYAIFGHCGDEVGHRRMLALMDAQPLLSLNLRLGEGTGALCAFPIIDSAVRMINELNNFQNAQITKYF
ncbi:nicotinate-nucleotide--dimethylbenzimidazole phosphoribosyltransferase [Hoylesella marshii]|uniref:Nicotinate-nucleotide--dimethylbenzimidazole phosphoribosyltransferase n=1 Tax=Hoylesella marshii DSM 16973 = JCM 13450 TaxID=862515 RepID=E0NT70_9BACT|nr:nicotinate-nucleotide--dimethylbenzimidazole phosphoribosyltransferase [Hoylesella marshii]EFM01685.1 nicotinate-nucleotide--dimethylbenzimidazole phosphoribosyltransferase [Hoylesella marshii DSM 16973 = JCM 13450]